MEMAARLLFVTNGGYFGYSCQPFRIGPTCVTTALLQGEGKREALMHPTRGHTLLLLTPTVGGPLTAQFGRSRRRSSSIAGQSFRWSIRWQFAQTRARSSNVTFFPSSVIFDKG